MAAVFLSPQNQPNTSMASGGWPRYVVFLLDQSGVLHDGTSPYPRAVEALSAMKRAGNTIGSRTPASGLASTRAGC